MNRDQQYEEWIGRKAFEDDGGWSKEVWDAAWKAGYESEWVLLRSKYHEVRDTDYWRGYRPTRDQADLAQGPV